MRYDAREQAMGEFDGTSAPRTMVVFRKVVVYGNHVKAC